MVESKGDGYLTGSVTEVRAYTITLWIARYFVEQKSGPASFKDEFSYAPNVFFPARPWILFSSPNSSSWFKYSRESLHSIKMWFLVVFSLPEWLNIAGPFAGRPFPKARLVLKSLGNVKQRRGLWHQHGSVPFLVAREVDKPEWSIYTGTSGKV